MNSELQSRPTCSSHFPTGMEIIHDDADAIADICLIHGAEGDLKTAWTKSEPWLKTLLPSHEVRILSYGYGPYDGPGERQFDVFDCTSDLRQGLLYHRQDSPSRPLIFVAHCVGGLVCKEVVNYCYYSHPTSYDAAIYSVLKGIILVGTPHKAPWKPITNARVARLYAGSTDVAAADTSNNLGANAKQGCTSSTHKESEGRVNESNHSSIMEAASLLTYHPDPATKPSVPELLATIDTIDEYEAIPIIADHIQMIKLSLSSEGSRRIAQTLDEWTSQIKLSQQTAPPASTSTMASFQTGRITKIARRRNPSRYLGRAKRHNVEGDPQLPMRPQASYEMLSPSPVPLSSSPPANFYMLRPCYILCSLMFLIIMGSASLGIYYSVRYDRMGDGFTAAGWIVATGTLLLAGPLAKHYPNCSCWGTKRPDRNECIHMDTLANS